MLNYFLNGSIAVAQFAIALFFLRFWKHSHDRLFAWFALAFLLFGVERVVLSLVDPASESRPFVYIIRLLAFSLIAYAIVEKNRSSGKAPPWRTSP